MILFDAEAPVFAGQGILIAPEDVFLADHPEIAAQSDQDGLFFL
jgi:hypothetical protein